MSPLQIIRYKSKPYFVFKASAFLFFLLFFLFFLQLLFPPFHRFISLLSCIFLNFDYNYCYHYYSPYPLPLFLDNNCCLDQDILYQKLIEYELHLRYPSYINKSYVAKTLGSQGTKRQYIACSSLPGRVQEWSTYATLHLQAKTLFL